MKKRDMCKWLYEYEGVCVNGESAERADFPSEETCEKCACWEESEAND